MSDRRVSSRLMDLPAAALLTASGQTCVAHALQVWSDALALARSVGSKRRIGWFSGVVRAIVVCVGGIPLRIFRGDIVICTTQ